MGKPVADIINRGGSSRFVRWSMDERWEALVSIVGLQSMNHHRRKIDSFSLLSHALSAVDTVPSTTTRTFPLTLVSLKKIVVGYDTFPCPQGALRAQLSHRARAAHGRASTC